MFFKYINLLIFFLAQKHGFCLQSQRLYFSALFRLLWIYHDSSFLSCIPFDLKTIKYFIFLFFIFSLINNIFFLVVLYFKLDNGMKNNFQLQLKKQNYLKNNEMENKWIVGLMLPNFKASIHILKREF